MEKDTYYLADEYYYKNAFVRVWRPILTEEERARRMERIRQAATALLQDAYAREALAKERKEAEDAEAARKEGAME